VEWDQGAFAAGGGFAMHNGILDISISDSVCSLTRASNAVAPSHCLKVSSSLGFEPLSLLFIKPQILKLVPADY